MKLCGNSFLYLAGTYFSLKKGAWSKRGQKCLYIELFTWKMPHLYLFLCKKKVKALRFGICHSLPKIMRHEKGKNKGGNRFFRFSDRLLNRKKMQRRPEMPWQIIGTRFGGSFIL